MIFTRTEWQAHSGAIVYIFWRGNDPLYIGESQRGLFRPMDPKHSAKQFAIFDTYDRVEIRLCSSKQEAKELQDELILSLDPILNITGRRRIRKSAGYGKAYSVHERRDLDTK